MPKTAIGLGVNPADTAQNARGSVDLMEQIHEQHPDWSWAQVMAAYNSNPATVARQIAKYGADWRRGLPPETQAYIKGFTGAVHQYAGTAPTAPTVDAPMSRDDQNQRALTAAINGLRQNQQRGANVHVNISNATGANVAVTGTQLAHGY